MGLVGYEHNPHLTAATPLRAVPVASNGQEDKMTRPYLFDSVDWAHLCLGIVTLGADTNRAVDGLDAWLEKWGF